MREPVRTRSAAVARRRLTPEARRTLLLDEAAALIVEEGISAVTIERVAAQALVSKALVYAYFGNRINLLSALLVREYPAFKDTGGAIASADERSFEEIVRESTHGYLDHVREKGVLLQRLTAEPGIVAAVSQHHRIGRDHTARYFAASMARDYPISEEKAVVVADILMGVTGAAGNLLSRERLDQRRISDLVVRIILAGVRQASGDQRSAIR